MDLLVEKDPIQHPKDNDGEEVASSGCKRGGWDKKESAELVPYIFSCFTMSQI
jgi:hypothetical protein